MFKVGDLVELKPDGMNKVHKWVEKLSIGVVVRTHDPDFPKGMVRVFWSGLGSHWWDYEKNLKAVSNV